MREEGDSSSDLPERRTTAPLAFSSVWQWARDSLASPRNKKASSRLVWREDLFLREDGCANAAVLVPRSSCEVEHDNFLELLFESMSRREEE